MDRPTRRRLLAGASTSLFAAVAGCLTGGDGDGTLTTVERPASTTESTDTRTRTTRTEEPTTAEPATATTEEPTTATTEEPTTAESTATTTEEPTTAESTAATTEEPTTTAAPEPAVVVAVGPGGATRFEPEEATVSVGAVVEWRWESDGHNVVVERQPSGGDWSGTGDAGTTFDDGYVHSHRFDVAGTYEYVCYPHQNLGMVGSVVVE